MTLSFVLAKLFGGLSWSWWGVLSPVFFGAAMFIVGFIILVFLEAFGKP